jgi:demethylmenaquinone methyltransferase/2-methoxy-6-polyprenyl-1,4-benzoquinol methylase
MFARIAPRYDLMNTLMTFGQDARWRRIVAELAANIQHSALSTQHSVLSTQHSALSTQHFVLDVGTGTGRLAEAVRRAMPAARVVGVDFTLAMLRRASIDVAAADALELPFADERFDAVMSAFLVRNLADLRRGIAEQVRVLRPGGLLAILETTPGPEGFLRPLYRLYFRSIVPLMGRLIAGDGAAYTYLPASTLAFLEPARLAELLRESGLRDVQACRLNFGTVAITLGRKAG